MNMKSIEYILAIAKYRSITYAAQALYISQSALSRYLSNLEKELDTVLFNRERNSLTLTRQGKIYVEYALQVQDGWNQMMARLKATGKSVVSVGYTMASNFMCLHQISSVFTNHFPDDEIRFMRIYDRQIEENLVKSSLSFALSARPANEDILSYEGSYEAYLILVVPKSIPLPVTPVQRPDCPYPWLDITAIGDLPFILPDKTTRIRQQVDQILEASGTILTNTPITTDNSLTSLFYTEQGHGLCISTENITSHFNLQDTCDVYCFGDPPATRRSGIIYLKTHSFSKQEQLCLELLRKYYHQ